MHMHRSLICAAAASLFGCSSSTVRSTGTRDADVYAAITAAWRVRSSQFGIAPDTQYTAAERKLVASIEEPSDSAAAADLTAFAAGVGLHYSRDTALFPQIRFVHTDSLYHPFPASDRTADYARRTIQLSQVVYVDDGRAALVYLSYSCCIMFGYESLLRLRYDQTSGWTLVRDEMKIIT
jgi:hypothetical protein